MGVIYFGSHRCTGARGVQLDLRGAAVTHVYSPSHTHAHTRWRLHTLQPKCSSISNLFYDLLYKALYFFARESVWTRKGTVLSENNILLFIIIIVNDVAISPINRNMHVCFVGACEGSEWCFRELCVRCLRVLHVILVWQQFYRVDDEDHRLYFLQINAISQDSTENWFLGKSPW